MGKKISVVALSIAVVSITLVILWGFRIDSGSSSNNNYLVNIESIDELDGIDTGTIYFGSDNCPTCVEFKPILEDFCNKNVSIVYYFDLGYLLDNKILDEVTLDTVLNKYQIEKFPTLITVRNSELDALVSFGHISSGNDQSISAQIKKFIYADDMETQSFFTQNNIEMFIIFLLSITIISAIATVAFIYKTKKYTYLFCSFYIVSMCGVFVLRHLLINGADNNYWSISISSTIILFATFLIDLVAVIILIASKKMKLEVILKQY